MMRDSVKDISLARLSDGAKKLDVDLGNSEEHILDYLDLLQKWNAAYNLTAVRDADEMLVRHIFDSLAVAPHIDRQSYIDVGTGAGLPGIVLAILFPEKHFSLLDSNGKKTRFLMEAKRVLNLKNVTVHKSRVEELTALGTYDGVLSRAFATLTVMADSSKHLLKSDGVFLAMKGRKPIKELAALPQNILLKSCYELSVPDLDEERHLLILEQIK